MNSNDELIEQLLENINSLSQFYEILESIKDDHELITVCKDMKSKTEIDYFDIAYNAMLKGYDIFMICDILKEIAFLSSMNIQSILKVYKHLYTTMINDLFSYMQFEITKNFCINSIYNAENLLEKLLKIDDSYTVGHIANIFIVLHNEHKKDQFLHIKQYLIDTSDEGNTLACIDAISKIELNDRQHYCYLPLTR